MRILSWKEIDKEFQKKIDRILFFEHERQIRYLLLPFFAKEERGICLGASYSVV
jgi:hypothetical protein